MIENKQIIIRAGKITLDIFLKPFTKLTKGIYRLVVLTMIMTLMQLAVCKYRYAYTSFAMRVQSPDKKAMNSAMHQPTQIGSKLRRRMITNKKNPQWQAYCTILLRFETMLWSSGDSRVKHTMNRMVIDRYAILYHFCDLNNLTLYTSLMKILKPSVVVTLSLATSDQFFSVAFCPAYDDLLAAFVIIIYSDGSFESELASGLFSIIQQKMINCTKFYNIQAILLIETKFEFADINNSCGYLKMQDENSNMTGMEVQLTEAHSLKYSEILQQFEVEMDRVNRQFQSSPEKIYYLLSCNFLAQWKNFCKSTSSTRLQPEPMNTDLIVPNTTDLVEGLVESENFVIVDKKIMNLFDNFPIAAAIRRVAYGSIGEKKVPIYTTAFNYLTLTQKDLQLFDKKAKERENLVLKRIKSLSFENTVEDLIKQIQFQQMLNKSYEFRVWIHKKDITLDMFYNHIVKECKPLSYEKMAIRGLGKKIQDNQQKIGAVDYEEGSYFVQQCIQYSRSVITAEDEGRCEECRTFAKLTHACGCKQVAYCSQKCYDTDRKYHIGRCKLIQEQELTKPVIMNMREDSRLGLVGLENLGNTCFMNSCLQCLSHTLPLTHYFLNAAYVPEINRDNPIGSKGKLVQAYANFIKNMWCEEESVYRPSRLKLAIADINKMFSGYAQHDSQQLFSFLVDGLHEDLNRIKKKPYVESVDSNGRADNIVSRESWLAYIQRNQSIITDTMVGQYKSKVICPDCKKQSITFDPFITVTLPIPEKWLNELKMYVLHSDFRQQTKKINIFYKNKSVEEIIQKTAAAIGRNKQQFRLYVLTFQEDIYSFHDTPRTELFSKIDTLSMQTASFVIEVSPQQIQLPNRIEIVTRFSKLQYGKFQPFWFKRPFFFNYKTVTGLDIFKRILKNLYMSTYSKSPKNQQNETKTYEQYEHIMLQSRPFKVVLRWGKKLKSTFSSYIQIIFDEQKQIQDHQQLNSLVNLQDMQDYEIDVRFSKQGLNDFDMDRLRSYSDITKKNSSNDEEGDNSKSTSLSQCFEALEQPEQLEKGNEWYCSGCKEHKLANKQLFIYKTPEILILHLKRFKQKGSYRKQKNQTNVDFPFELNIDTYIANPQPINAYIPFIKSSGKYLEPSYNLQINNPSTNYELYAVSNHYGGLGGGHYTAYAKNRGKWYSFNDSSVSAVSADRVKGSGAYILFYRRK